MYNAVKVKEIDEFKNKYKQRNVESKRIYYLDTLRIVAILCVILVHSAADVTQNINSIGSVHWWVANVVNSLCRWSVLAFFMISGALILDSPKEEDLKTFFHKRILKVAVPFVIWSIIYSLAKHYIINKDFPSILAMPKIFAQEFLFDGVYCHLWFMYVILTIYLVLPFMKKIVKNLTKGEIEFWLVIWFVLSFLYKVIQQVYFNIYNKQLYLNLFDIPFFTGYIGFFILGYYLHKYELKKITKYTVYVLGFISFLTIPLMTYVNSAGKEFLDETFYMHFSITSIFTSTAMFLLFKSVNWESIFNNKTKKLITSMSNATFGIYLVHLLIQVLLLRFFLEWLVLDNLFVIALYAVNLLANFGICYIFIKIVSLNNKFYKLLFS